MPNGPVRYRQRRAVRRLPGKGARGEEAALSGKARGRAMRLVREGSAARRAGAMWRLRGDTGGIESASRPKSGGRAHCRKAGATGSARAATGSAEARGAGAGPGSAGGARPATGSAPAGAGGARGTGAGKQVSMRSSPSGSRAVRRRQGGAGPMRGPRLPASSPAGARQVRPVLAAGYPDSAPARTQPGTPGNRRAAQYAAAPLRPVRRSLPADRPKAVALRRLLLKGGGAERVRPAGKGANRARSNAPCRTAQEPGPVAAHAMPAVLQRVSAPLARR